MYLLISLFLIFFEAIPEALRDKGKKKLAGRIEFIYRAVITLIAFEWLIGNPNLIHVREFGIGHVLIGYVLVRYALFDLIYNSISQLPWSYLGTTKDSDISLNWFLNKTRIPDDAFLGPTKLIAFFWGVAWLLIQNPN